MSVLLLVITMLLRAVSGLLLPSSKCSDEVSTSITSMYPPYCTCVYSVGKQWSRNDPGCVQTSGKVKLDSAPSFIEPSRSKISITSNKSFQTPYSHLVSGDTDHLVTLNNQAVARTKLIAVTEYIESSCISTGGVNAELVAMSAVPMKLALGELQAGRSTVMLKAIFTRCEVNYCRLNYATVTEALQSVEVCTKQRSPLVFVANHYDYA
jgi:hypothetical protein